MKLEVIFGIILILIFLIIVMRPLLEKLLVRTIHRWVMGKMEDNMRRMAGMPTRKEEKMAQKRARRREKGGATRFRRAAEGSRNASRRRRPRSTVALLKGFAEDVEFIEIKDYSADTPIGAEASRSKQEVVVEEQIVDVEFIEIKQKHS